MLKLLLLPQRYVFSSKSQLRVYALKLIIRCYCYHKGTYFQANHNIILNVQLVINVVIATTKVRIFKQITTLLLSWSLFKCCYCYHKGTYFQANHNYNKTSRICRTVVIATTKVRIFKQITTYMNPLIAQGMLLLLPQRYVFSSKSQPSASTNATVQSCYCYHKGTYFQANHNSIVN